MFMAVCAFSQELGGFDCDPCHVYQSQDYLNVDVISMEPIDSTHTKIVLGFEWFNMVDNHCADLRIRVHSECGTDYYAPVCDRETLAMCSGWFCWNSDSSFCEGEGLCCGSYYPYVYSTWQTTLIVSGKGVVRILWGGVIYREFPFEPGIPGGYGTPKFTGISFLNRDHSAIADGDVFDANEGIAIRIMAEWEGEISPEVAARLYCSHTSNKMYVELSMTEQYGNNAIYIGDLGPGSLLELTGEPSGLPPGGAYIVATPHQMECDTVEVPTLPRDELHVVNYILSVEEVSFAYDHTLFKDSSAAMPPKVQRIQDPVWIRNGNKNDPAAYTMGSIYSMNVVVKNNYLPLHDFQYMIRGYFPPDLVTYSTESYTGQMIYSRTDTISGIAPRNDKPFQDSVGILENLNIFWVVNKSLGPGLDDYDIMNTSGPHKIFLTYDTPLLDTVNILALGKICKYANGLDSVRTIAQAGVTGTYGEGWNYDINHDTFKDPLDVIRQHIGMCTDYANLLTCLYRSIGVSANSTIIFNGLNATPDTMKILFWRYTEVLDTSWVSLLTKRLRACDSDTRNWQFAFHAVSSVVRHKSLDIRYNISL